jgi:hypothetical protein
MKKGLIIVLSLVILAGMPLVTRAATPVDNDHDGLVDEQEIQFKTDIHNPDTDGDGFVDGLEIAKTNCI